MNLLKIPDGIYSVDWTTKFKRDYKRIVKQGRDINALERVIVKLACGEVLEPRYHDHCLSTEFPGCRECHITPDWLLIYKISDQHLILTLMRTGSHTEVLKM